MVPCTVNKGSRAHAEGYYCTASGEESHAEGYQSSATADYTHAEGYNSTASAYTAHAEGSNTTGSGSCSHAEGDTTEASGDESHAEGYKSKAKGTASHAEGYETEASGFGSHSEGTYTKATSYRCHAEGWMTSATADNAHAEGAKTEASGSNSHAEGFQTKAVGDCAHAGGYGVTAGANQFVYGHVTDDKFYGTGVPTCGDGIVFAVAATNQAYDISQSVDLTGDNKAWSCVLKGNGKVYLGLKPYAVYVLFASNYDTSTGEIKDVDVRLIAADGGAKTYKDLSICKSENSAVSINCEIRNGVTNIRLSNVSGRCAQVSLMRVM